jgi:hypothetical protein
MNLIQKIKSYFLNYEFYSWKDFSWDDYELNFISVNDETLVDIGHYLIHNLDESSRIGNRRYRLSEDAASEFRSLDELLQHIREIIARDYRETSVESRNHDWDFRYFVNHHPLCGNTICISNGLRSRSGNTGNCIYALISIRKYNNRYYCWNHLGKE